MVEEKPIIPLADWAKLSGIATAQDILDVKEEVDSTNSSLENYATKDELASTVDEKVAALVGSAPETLDTLQELAEALKANEENDKSVAAELLEMVGSNKSTIEELSNTVEQNKEEAAAAVQEVSDKVDAIPVDTFALKTEVEQSISTVKSELEEKVSAVDTKVDDSVSELLESINQVESQIPDVSNFATFGYVDNNVSTINTKIAEVESKIPTLPVDHVTQTELQEAIDDVVAQIPDVTPFATTESVNASVQELTTKIDTVENKVDSIPVDTFATKEEVAAVDTKVDSIPVDTFAVKTQVASDIATAVSGVTLDSLGYVAPTVESLGAATKTSVDELAVVVDGKATPSYVDTKVAELVDGAPEALDTLRELAEALKENKDGVTALVEQIGTVDAKVDAISVDSLGAAHKEHTHTLADVTDYVAPDLTPYAKSVDVTSSIDTVKSELQANIDTVKNSIPTKLPNPEALTIKYNGTLAFTYDGSTAQSGNFIVTADTVPGVAKQTDLEALSTIVDTKAESVHTHTLSEITDYSAPDLTPFATKEEVEEVKDSIPDISPLATKSEVTVAVSGAKSELQSNIDAVQASIPDVSDVVRFQDFVYNEQTRKTIQLDNYDSISGLMTDGIGVNLAMVSKWDVADFGSTKLHANLNTSDAVTVNDSLVVVTTPVNTDDPTKTVFDLNTVIDNRVASMSGDIEQVLNRLNAVEDQVVALKKTNVVPVVLDGSANLNQSDADLVVAAGDDPVSTSTVIVGKSVDVKSIDVESAMVSVKAVDGDVVISNYSSSGDLPKSTSNAQLKVQSSEYIKITSSNFNQTGYNAIEIGLDTSVTPPKNVVIDGLDFSAKLSNNAILIFGHQEDAVITISNCHFADISNAIRISNRLNVRGTFNFINCTCDKWETKAAYAGFVLLEDYTSKSVTAEESNNLFGPDKITINFINCYGPNGKIMASDPSEVCGTGVAATQVLYVYNDYGYSIAYDSSRYPTVTFK